jgi:hypothetical protein
MDNEDLVIIKLLESPKTPENFLLLKSFLQLLCITNLETHFYVTFFTSPLKTILFLTTII